MCQLRGLWSSRSVYSAWSKSWLIVPQCCLRGDVWTHSVGKLSLPPSQWQADPRKSSLSDPSGFGVMPRGGLGQGCLLVHATGMFDPSDRGPVWEVLPGIGCKSPEDVLSTGSDTSLDQSVQTWMQRGRMAVQLSWGKLAAV